jgi:hypothetical protein
LLKLLLVFAKIVVITSVFEKSAILFAENWQKSQKIKIITSVFEKNAIFFAENWQKSQKIVIITSTPGERASSKPGHVAGASAARHPADEDLRVHRPHLHRLPPGGRFTNHRFGQKSFRTIIYH